MKRNLKFSFVIAVLIGLTVVANAQTEKGNFIIGASSSLDFTSSSIKLENDLTSTDSGNMTTFEFTPGAGYFIANNLAFGIMLSLESSSEKEDGDKYTETTTALFPFALLYFGKSNVKPFVQAAFGPGWQKSGYEEKETQNITGYQLGGGLAVFVNQHVSLDFSLGYASASAKIKDGYNVDWKVISKGIGGNVGFSIVF